MIDEGPPCLGGAARRLTRLVACHGTASLVGEERQRPRPPAMNKTNHEHQDEPVDRGHIDEPMLLRPREAAKLLAISPRKLWELTNTKEVPVVRIGRSLRYPREALRGWVASRQGRRS